MAEESKTQKEVIKHAERLGWVCYKFSSPFCNGVPDYLLMKPSHGWYTVCFMEFKARGKGLKKKLQEYHKRLIEKTGIKVHRINSVQTGRRILESYEDI